MPIKVTIVCPQCGNVSAKKKPIPAGAKVRCSRCSTVFRFSLSDNDLVGDEPSVDPAQPELLRELFAVSEPSKPEIFDEEAGGRYRGVTNHSLVGIESVTSRSRGSASVRSKDSLIGGKPDRFTGTRQFTAVILAVVVMGMGYAGFVVFNEFFTKMNDTAAVLEANRKARANPKGQFPKKGALAKGNKQVEIPKPARTIAPAPLRIEDMEVVVAEAIIQKLNPNDTEDRLDITLQITNLSRVDMRYRPWSQPGNGVVLRVTSSTFTHEPLGPAAINETVLKPHETIKDILVFKPRSSLFGLDLDLPVSADGHEQYHFHLPVQFLQRVQ